MFHDDSLQLIFHRSDGLFRGADKEFPAGVLPNVLSEEIEPFGDMRDFRLLLR